MRSTSSSGSSCIVESLSSSPISKCSVPGHLLGQSQLPVYQGYHQQVAEVLELLRQGRRWSGPNQSWLSIVLSWPCFHRCHGNSRKLVCCHRNESLVPNQMSSGLECCHWQWQMLQPCGYTVQLVLLLHQESGRSSLSHIVLQDKREGEICL